MNLKPRNPRRDRLVNEALAAYSYFQIGEACSCTGPAVGRCLSRHHLTQCFQLVPVSSQEQSEWVKVIHMTKFSLCTVFRCYSVLCRLHRLLLCHGPGGLVPTDVCGPSCSLGECPPARHAGQLWTGMG